MSRFVGREARHRKLVRPELEGEPVATLDEVLLRAKGKARVGIELKYYGHDPVGA